MGNGIVVQYTEFGTVAQRLLEVAENSVPVVFDQSLEMEQRVTERGVELPAARQAVDYCADHATVRRIVDAHDNLRALGLLLYPEIDPAPARKRADERHVMAVDETVALEELLVVAGEA